VRCGDSFAIAVRWRRPSASISRRTGFPRRAGRGVRRWLLPREVSTRCSAQTSKETPARRA
jgi:hypothetical protein